jgi:hypothetical protein
MGYYEWWSVVAGAVEQEGEVDSDGELDTVIDAIKVDAERSEVETEVYARWHEHEHFDENELVPECACADYETDHHPTVTFNSKRGLI